MNGCLYLCVFAYVCVSQHFFGHVCPPHSTYTAPRPVPTGSVHAQKHSQLFSNWFRCRSLRVRESSSRQVRQRVFSPPPKLGSSVIFFEFSERRTNVPELRNTAEPRHLFDNRQHVMKRPFFYFLKFNVTEKNSRVSSAAYIIPE